MNKTDADSILDCAVELFRNKGYKGTSMADIGNATGLLKGSIYHHFKSKEDILVASLQKLNVFFNDQVFAIAYEETRPASARLKEMLGVIESYFDEYKACVIAHLILEDIRYIPEAEGALRTFFNHWHQAFAHIFSEKHGKDVSRKLAEDAICRIEGAILWLKLFGDRKPLVRANIQIRSLL